MKKKSHQFWTHHADRPFVQPETRQNFSSSRTFSYVASFRMNFRCVLAISLIKTAFAKKPVFNSFFS